MILGFAGTTAATVLTRAIFAEGCKSVAAGMNAMDLRRGINLAVESVVNHLKGRARMISSSEEIAQVITYCWTMSTLLLLLCVHKLLASS
jgi:chaperonin GroEL (HSP60 family)